MWCKKKQGAITLFTSLHIKFDAFILFILSVVTFQLVALSKLFIPEQKRNVSKIHVQINLVQGIQDIYLSKVKLKASV